LFPEIAQENFNFFLVSIKFYKGKIAIYFAWLKDLSKNRPIRQTHCQQKQHNLTPALAHKHHNPTHSVQPLWLIVGW
jgi:hypothetical protein